MFFPVPIKFFLTESQTPLICSVLLRVSLACERGEERKGEEELSSSHISVILYPDKQKFHKLSLDFERKIR